MVNPINSFPDFSGIFGDKRIDNRANRLLNVLTQGRSSSIRQITSSEGEQKSFYRLFNNESFSEATITNAIVNRCGQLCHDRHVLCIQDTTEFNLSSNEGRIKPSTGLGKTTKEGILGFMLHSSIVIDPDKDTALGYSHIKVWDRKQETPDKHKRNYNRQPIAEKESYKWMEASQNSKQLLSEAQTITIIADRESDIYDLLATIPDERTHLLIRSNHNRKIEGGGTLTTHLNAITPLHDYHLMVRGDVRKKIEKRTVDMELKWIKVSIVKPSGCKDQNLVDSVEVYVVEAKERGKNKGIHWRIITTHPVENTSDAMQIIEWYKHRCT